MIFNNDIITTMVMEVDEGGKNNEHIGDRISESKM